MSETQQIGRYRIVEELGRGAMGRVLRAEDPTIGRQVAIKIISLAPGSSGEEQELFERSFLREIRSAGALHHPGIVSIFDAGRQDDLAYIVMELVDGVTFDGMLRSQPRPDIPSLLRVCREVAGALDYAHARGIIHRDIKPANILVGKNGAARVADFGIAKVPRHGTTISFDKTIVGAGTPEFMSPEQIQGKALDGRTDQWSLAVMAYTALTDAKPFGAEQMAVVIGQIVGIDPVPPCRLNPSLAPVVDEVMAKALSKDPALRYQSCTDFVEALETAYSGSSVQPQTREPETREPQQQPERVSPKREVGVPEIERSAAGPRSHMPMVGAVIGVLVAIMAAIFFLTHRPAAPQASVEPPAASAPPSVDTPTPPAARPKTAPTVAPSRPVQVSKKTYQIRLVTNPADADLTIDNKADSACKSPCTVELTEGSHALVVKKDGYHTLVQSIQVSGDQPEVTIPLEEVTGSLVIETQPPGAAIALNDKPRAETTPATLTLPPGKYKVRLTKEGFDPREVDTNVLVGAMREIGVTLEKSSGN